MSVVTTATRVAWWALLASILPALLLVAVLVAITFAQLWMLVFGGIGPGEALSPEMLAGSRTTVVAQLFAALGILAALFLLRGRALKALAR
ncbi:MAG: hypothetical protein ACREO3_10250 [Arenimonas sp.]